jgi:endonuclease/exonuclease/phosphatase family metal-dependent hydrolase
MLRKKAALFCITLAIGCYTLGGQEAGSTRDGKNPPFEPALTIMSFNIQIFGASKMAKPEVAGILADIVSRAGIIAVQEVRSASIAPVEQFMALLPEQYRYVIGPRLGRSISKEQYWVLYDSSRVTVLREDTWPDEADIFERDPFAVYCSVADTFDFILINTHIQPGNAAREIQALPEVAAYYRDVWNEPDVLIVGDFNADGNYFDELLLESIFPENEYHMIISNEYDTTVGKNEYTYDRFIITASAIEDFTGSFGVIRFDEVYDFSAYTIRPKQVSDHYPVWADFWTDQDTD